MPEQANTVLEIKLNRYVAELQQSLADAHLSSIVHKVDVEYATAALEETSGKLNEANKLVAELQLALNLKNPANSSPVVEGKVVS